MDPLTALCLSVPPSVAIVFAAHVGGEKLHFALVTMMGNWCDGALAAARGHREAIENAADALADAHVKAAKYHAKAITVKPKVAPPGPPSIYDRWLAREGHKLPETVRDQVEWAIGALRGEEPDGDDDTASVILTQYAHGVEQAVRDEIARGAR